MIVIVDHDNRNARMARDLLADRTQQAAQGSAGAMIANDDHVRRGGGVDQHPRGVARTDLGADPRALGRLHVLQHLGENLVDPLFGRGPRLIRRQQPPRTLVLDREDVDPCRYDARLSDRSFQRPARTVRPVHSDHYPMRPTMPDRVDDSDRTRRSAHNPLGDRAQQQQHEGEVARRIKRQRRQRQPDHGGEVANPAERKIARQDDRQKQENELIGIEEHMALSRAGRKA